VKRDASPEGAQPRGASEPPDHRHEAAIDFEIPPPARISTTQLAGLGAVVVLVLGAAFLSTYLPRKHQKAELAAATKANEARAPKLDVVTPKVVSSDHALVLPATIQPLEETTIYPRANGYVRNWLVDIGDKVEAGTALAEIDTPEIDQDLAAAEAQLGSASAAVTQAKANLELSRTTAARAEKLAADGITSPQDLEQKRAQVHVDEANLDAASAGLRSAQANVKRQEELKSFAKLVAPFAGTVTSRTIERGALVSAGQTSPLFKVAVLDPVRVLVAVPQDVAPAVEPGAKADVGVREFPGKKFEGTIARSTRELDAASRTMMTEVRVPNADGKLLAGMYADVSLSLAAAHRVLEVPSTALYSDAQGQRVAVVAEDGRVHYAPVVVERDTGPTVEIASGISETDRVVKISDASLDEGEIVDVAK
jgi:RND family efflux transporter MFP subunit